MKNAKLWYCVCVRLCVYWRASNVKQSNIFSYESMSSSDYLQKPEHWSMPNTNICHTDPSATLTRTLGDFWLVIFGLVSLVSNMSSVIFGLGSAIWHLWFGTVGWRSSGWSLCLEIFGLESLTWEVWFGIIGLSFLRWDLWSMGSVAWDLWFGALVWKLWFEIFDSRSSVWDL